jgi:hypothetical protein
MLSLESGSQPAGTEVYRGGGMASTVPEDVENLISVRIQEITPEFGVSAKAMAALLRLEWLDGYSRGYRFGHGATLLPESSLENDIHGVCA